MVRIVACRCSLCQKKIVGIVVFLLYYVAFLILFLYSPGYSVLVYSGALEVV
jgi:hypothetical protein